MTVKFYLSDNPRFVFDTRLVPADHFISYDYESDIFAYLNSNLLPTDIESVRIESDGINSILVIVYKLDDPIINGMPPFDPIPFDDDAPLFL